MKKIIIHIFMLLAALMCLLPFIWMLSASLMQSGHASVYPPRFIPDKITFEQYANLFQRLNVSRYLFNSVAVSILITVISLFVNSMAGFAFAKYRFRGKDKLFKILLSFMIVPAQVTMLPLFLMLKEMGFINTYMALIIPGMASVFGIFLIRQYLLSIPDSLIESAKIDGASDLRIYFSIILPLAKPILITLAIFTFMGTWNDFLWPLIAMTDNSMYTLPVALANLMGEHTSDTELMMAGSVITILPILIIFLILQKQYVKGIMLGSVKG